MKTRAVLNFAWHFKSDIHQLEFDIQHTKIYTIVLYVSD